VADRPFAFKVDEKLPDEIARILRGAGYDAVTIDTQKLSGTPDAHLADVVLGEGRALVTLDLDFADIRAYPPERYAGIIILRVRRQDKLHVCSVMERVVPMCGVEPGDGPALGGGRDNRADSRWRRLNVLFRDCPDPSAATASVVIPAASCRARRRWAYTCRRSPA
jgi:predicted nuclease of predicted toxin-antitoxin system